MTSQKQAHKNLHVYMPRSQAAIFNKHNMKQGAKYPKDYLYLEVANSIHF